MAAMGQTPAGFEHFLYRVPHSSWQRLPDAEFGGLLYEGTVGSFDTIVHVFLKNGRVNFERVEVALPNNRNDDLALAIITRFLCEYVGHPQELQSVMSTMRALHTTLLGSGRRSARMPYRKATFQLSLSTAPSEFNPDMIEEPWGMLYWKAEASPSVHPKRKSDASRDANF